MTRTIVHVPRGGELGPRLHLGFERAARAVIEAKRSPHTKAAYRADLRLWLSFCATEDIDPTLANLEQSTAFREYLEAHYPAKESARRVIAAMSSVYRSLLRGGAVRTNPFHPAMLTWPPANALPRARLVTDAHARAMIAHAHGESVGRPERAARDVAILRLLYDTGLRRSSVAKIVRATYIDGRIQAIVKGDKEIEISLPIVTTAAIDAWLAHRPDRGPYLFPSSDGGHLHPVSINKLVRRHAKAVGATHVHPHSFRAAFVTAGYDAGLPEHEIQASVHHSDPKTTRRYDRRVRGRAVAAAVETFRKTNPAT